MLCLIAEIPGAILRRHEDVIDAWFDHAKGGRPIGGAEGVFSAGEVVIGAVLRNQRTIDSGQPGIVLRRSLDGQCKTVGQHHIAGWKSDGRRGGGGINDRLRVGIRKTEIHEEKIAVGRIIGALVIHRQVCQIGGA